MANHGAFCSTWEKPDNKISDPIDPKTSDPIMEDQIRRVFGPGADVAAIKSNMKAELRERATKDEGMKKWLRGGGYKFGKLDQPTISHFLNVGKKDYEDVTLKQILFACSKYCERVEGFFAGSQRVAILVYEVIEKKPSWLETEWYTSLYLSLRNKGYQVITMEHEGREQLQIHIKRAAEAIAASSNEGNDKSLFVYMHIHGMISGASHIFDFESEDKSYSLPDILHEAALEKQVATRQVPKFFFVDICPPEQPKRVKYVSRHSLSSNTVAVYPPLLKFGDTNVGEYPHLIAKHCVEGEKGEDWTVGINGLAGCVVGRGGGGVGETQVESNLTFPFSFKFNK